MNRYCAGVFIENTPGGGDYEFYSNVNGYTTFGTEAARGKVVWISTTGLVRIGNNGSGTSGYTPGSGRAIVIGNIFLEGCTTGARTANAINSTITSRYKFTSPGEGVLSINKCSSAWYVVPSSPYSIALTNSAFVDAVSITRPATNLTLTNVGISSATTLNSTPLTLNQCIAGGSISNCVFSNGISAVSLIDDIGISLNQVTLRRNDGTSMAAFSLARSRNITITAMTLIATYISVNQSAYVNIANTVFVSGLSGTQIGTPTNPVFALGSTTSYWTIDGLSFPVTNNHPATYIVTATSSVNNIIIKNIGTYIAPLNCGTINPCDVISISSSGAVNNFSIKRCYFTNTYTGIIQGGNTNSNILMENVFGDYADNSDVANCNDQILKGIGGVMALTAQSGVFGTHFRDNFTSTTAGMITIMMNDISATSASYVTLSGGALFNGVGGLSMPTIGQSCTWETPYYIIGHTGFSNNAPIMAGGTIGNFKIEFQIDVHDGVGYSAWAIASGANLSGLTGINAVLGFKLKIRITTTSTNTDVPTSIYLQTTSTTTTQAYQYPLYTLIGVLQNIATGSNYWIAETANLSNVLATGSQSGVANIPISFLSNSDSLQVTIRVRKFGYVPFETLVTLTSSGGSVYVSQIVDTTS